MRTTDFKVFYLYSYHVTNVTIILNILCVEEYYTHMYIYFLSYIWWCSREVGNVCFFLQNLEFTGVKVLPIHFIKTVTFPVRPLLTPRNLLQKASLRYISLDYH